MKDVIVISNLRILLIYLLVINENLDNKYFIFEEKTELDLLILNKIYYKNRCHIVKTKNIFLKIFNKLRKYREQKKFIEENHLENIEKIYGVSHIGIGNYFVKKYNFYLIEDGLMNYMEQLYKRTYKDIILNRERMGLHKNVKKIYLTGLGKVPEVIKKKVEIVNLEELWNKKSEDKRKQINEIFGVNVEALKKIADRKIMLFTQPLSEDGIISEREKIDLYSKILNKYQQKNVVIKPHPREKTDYSDYFLECCVMKEKYPVELMIFNGLKIDRAVTLFSTAIFSLNKMVKVDFYGTEVHPKLLEKFGSMEHIMKRNCYL